MRVGHCLCVLYSLDVELQLVAYYVQGATNMVAVWVVGFAADPNASLASPINSWVMKGCASLGRR